MTTVLIVEDDAASNNFYASALSRDGFTVIQATSYQQAIKYLQGVVPNVILLDLTLRDGSGLTVLNYLREHAQFQRTKVAIISGSIRYREDITRVGNVEYLHKPVLADALCDCVRRLAAAQPHAN
jgi:DNA-binding response OmpR family regulator